MFSDPSDRLPNGKLKFIRDTPSKERERDILEKLWERYKPYADANFKTAIASNFQSHFWEIFLAVTLLDLGFNLRNRAELGKKGPDISIRSNETNIWIEAIACNTIPDDFAVFENESEPIDESVILRYTSAIDEKFKKYKNYLQEGMLSASEPYIIAINSSSVPFSLPDNDQSNTIPDVIKAVIPFGDYTITMDRNTNEVTNSGYSYRPKIIKPYGKPVQTDIFLDSNYEGISAILHSTMNISDNPNLYGTDFLFFHNPKATNRLPRG